MIYKGIELHNINDIITRDGVEYISRLPERLHQAIGNERGFEMTGVEIRFIPLTPVRIHIGSAKQPYTQSKVRVMYDGYFQKEELLINENTVIDIHPLEIFTETFKPNVEVRVVLSGAYFHIDKIEGEFKLFSDSRPKYLSYGTSITQGYYTNHAEGAYPYILARNLDYDVQNYGMAGSAYCEDETADFLCSLGEFDLITLELSVNMFADGYSVETFKTRVLNLITKLRQTSSNAKIYCIGILPFFVDLGIKDPFNLSPDVLKQYRDVYYELVQSFNDDKIIYVEAKDLLSPKKLCTDLLHPSSSGMYEIAYKLTNIIEEK